MTRVDDLKELLITVLALFCITVFKPVSGFAAEEQRTAMIEDYLKQAELVFKGKVIDISYALSSEGSESLPHTFVTYRVQHIFKGRVKGKKVTLRFLGGPDVDGTILMVNDFPRFDMKDRDILFVRGNEESICPLVDCTDSRMRIARGRIYNENGRELLRNDNRDFVWGDTADLAQVSSHRIGDKTFINKINHAQSFQINGEPADSNGSQDENIYFGAKGVVDYSYTRHSLQEHGNGGNSRQVSLKNIHRDLTRTVRANYSKRALRRMRRIASADINEPFVSTLPRIAVRPEQDEQ